MGLLGWFVLCVIPSSAFALSTLTEDFTTLDHADPVNSTGIWNIVDHSARARAYANGAVESTRPIDFGDGHDGIVDTSNGYVFNTDTHPNGYSFQSLSITGGTVTVVGSHALVIRSLSTITITPPLQVNGADGESGDPSGGAHSGGAAVTCSARGGDGGGATATTASNGGDTVYSTGATEASTHGVGQFGGAYASGVESQIPSFTGPGGYDFDTDPANHFICGSSGAGGGGDTMSTEYASGGSGGAGGGRMALIAVGDIQVGATEARGGVGGDGVQLSDGSCSGTGTGGNGGVIFFQTLGNLSTGVDPDVRGSDSGTSPCFAGNGVMLDGYARGDLNSANSTPGWEVVSYATEQVPASLQSEVQSKAYDLGVLNASFSNEVIDHTGDVTVTYAGSPDGVSFSDFGDLQSVSNQGYRYLKFRATFTNPSSGNVAPKMTGLHLTYSDAGLTSVDAKLFAGCGTLASGGAKHGESKQLDEAGTLFTLLALMLFYGISRFRMKV